MKPVLIAVVAAVLAFSAVGMAHAEQAAVCPDGQYPGNNGCVSPQCTDGKTALVVDEDGNIEYHCINTCSDYSLDTAPGTDMCKGYGLIKHTVNGMSGLNALFSKSGCPDALPFWDGNSCVAACPSGLAAGINCMDQCAGDAPMQDGAQCVAACPADRPLSTGTECVAMCPSYASFKIGTSCMAECPPGMAAVGRLCMPESNTASGTSGGTESQSSMPDLCNFGIPGRVNPDLISSATMDATGMTVYLADPTKQFQRYVLNFCNAATGEKAGTGTSDISKPIKFDNDKSRLVMSYDPHTIYMIQAVGNNYGDKQSGKTAYYMISPRVTVSYDDATATGTAGGQSESDTPQPTMTQQYVPAQEPEPETAQQQDEPPRLPSKSSQEQQQEQQQQQDEPPRTPSQSSQTPSGQGSQGPSGDNDPQSASDGSSGSNEQEAPPSINEIKIRDLEERIQRLDYRIGVAQDLLDNTKPHQEKRIDKLNKLIDKLTDRKAVLQERLDALS